MIKKIKQHKWQLNIALVNNYIQPRWQRQYSRSTNQTISPDTNRFFHYSHNNSKPSIVYIPIIQPGLNTQIELSSPKP